MKKRTIFLAAGLCMLALFAGCGKDKADNNGENNNSAEEYVTLGEYNGIELSVEKSEITEEDVKLYIESILAYYPAYENTDKTVVENGDIVNIDYEGLLDGVAFSGGTAQDQILEIGSGSFIDGFEDGLIGANVGDSLALNLTFPDPYENNPDLAGQAVVFNVTVNAIVQKVEMTYDTMTDEYVAENLSTVFGYDTAQGLKDGVMEYMNSSNEATAESNARTALITKLGEICTINELPEGLLDERVNEYEEQFAAMCQEQYGMEVADYLETYYQTTEEDFHTETEEYMKENIELELILLAIAEKEGVEADEEGYQEYVAALISNYGFESEEALIEEYGEDYIKDSYLCNKVVDTLLEKAVITYTAPVEE